MKFVVNGGRKLEGQIDVRGSKNAALPIIASTLLTETPCVIENIPLIGDVLTLIEIIRKMGSDIEWIGERSVRIVNKDIDTSKLDGDLVCKIRSSILLLGPILARFGEIKINTPGGCRIGVRPMDAHFDAFKDLGFSVDYDEKKDIYSVKKISEPKSREVVLKEFSVTATENIMIYSAFSGGTKIKLVALEPHVTDLGRFLITLGAEIGGLGTHEIDIKRGIEKGKEVNYSIMSDPIEAGTFMVLGIATGSDIVINKVPVDSLTLPFLKLEEFGAKFSVNGDSVKIENSGVKLRAVKKIEVRPYPGFPSDLQAPFGVLATQAEGETLIFDTLYEGRLKYLYELEKMGAIMEILDPHRAIIKGPTELIAKEVESIDLRAGATLVIAALVAEGESTLHTAEQIDRGYEKIEERLNSLGAQIKRVK